MYINGTQNVSDLSVQLLYRLHLLTCLYGIQTTHVGLHNRQSNLVLLLSFWSVWQHIMRFSLRTRVRVLTKDADH
ncbi:hypothetical protein D3C86_2032660 [compost metagenome]